MLLLLIFLLPLPLVSSLPSPSVPDSPDSPSLHLGGHSSLQSLPRLASRLLWLWSIPPVRSPREEEGPHWKTPSPGPSLQDLFTSEAGAFIKYEDTHSDEEESSGQSEDIDRVENIDIVTKQGEIGETLDTGDTEVYVDESIDSSESALVMAELRDSLINVGNTIVEVIRGVLDTVIEGFLGIRGLIMANRREDIVTEDSFSPITFIYDFLESLQERSGLNVPSLPPLNLTLTVNKFPKVQPELENPAELDWQHAWIEQDTQRGTKRRKRSTPRLFFPSFPGGEDGGVGGVGGVVEAVDTMVDSVVGTVVQAVMHTLTTDIRQEATFYSYRSGS